MTKEMLDLNNLDASKPLLESTKEKLSKFCHVPIFILIAPAPHFDFHSRHLPPSIFIFVPPPGATFPSPPPIFTFVSPSPSPDVTFPASTPRNENGEHCHTPSPRAMRMESLLRNTNDDQKHRRKQINENKTKIKTENACNRAFENRFKKPPRTGLKAYFCTSVTTIRHVNKTDVVTLDTTFGSFSHIIGAFYGRSNLPWLGERKSKRSCFLKLDAIKNAIVDICVYLEKVFSRVNSGSCGIQELLCWVFCHLKLCCLCCDCIENTDFIVETILGCCQVWKLDVAVNDIHTMQTDTMVALINHEIVGKLRPTQAEKLCFEMLWPRFIRPASFIEGVMLWPRFIRPTSRNDRFGQDSSDRRRLLKARCFGQDSSGRHRVTIALAKIYSAGLVY
ncbi:hypothetical protein Fmac_025321 [Flemingia macrophylla]|uniref:Uncharacterized protein n=1 Tax=Flemingia macrophylla TaxID=520843 RepID=A0ABD1LRW1_9FABA